LGIGSIGGGTTDWSAEKVESAARHASSSGETGMDWALAARLVTKNAARKRMVARSSGEMPIQFLLQSWIKEVPVTQGECRWIEEQRLRVGAL
jgi:hypothetical protein